MGNDDLQTGRQASLLALLLGVPRRSCASLDLSFWWVEWVVDENLNLKPSIPLRVSTNPGLL